MKPQQFRKSLTNKATENCQKNNIYTFWKKNILKKKTISAVNNTNYCLFLNLKSSYPLPLQRMCSQKYTFQLLNVNAGRLTATGHLMSLFSAMRHAIIFHIKNCGRQQEKRFLGTKHTHTDAHTWRKPGYAKQTIYPSISHLTTYKLWLLLFIFWGWVFFLSAVSICY